MRRLSTAGSFDSYRCSSNVLASWTSVCAVSFRSRLELRSFYGGMAERCAEVAVKVGAISEFERRAWLDAFHERGAEGPIIAGRLRVFVWGRKE